MKAIRTIRVYKREEIEIDEKFVSYDEDNFPYLTEEGLEKYVFSLEKRQFFRLSHRNKRRHFIWRLTELMFGFSILNTLSY